MQFLESVININLNICELFLSIHLILLIYGILHMNIRKYLEMWMI